MGRVQQMNIPTMLLQYKILQVLKRYQGEQDDRRSVDPKDATCSNSNVHFSQSFGTLQLAMLQEFEI